MMETSERLTGTIRLNKEMRAEMIALGFTSPSEYIKHKMESGHKKLAVLKNPDEKGAIRHLPVTNNKNQSDNQLTNKLTIQRLSLENQKLQEKLEEITKSNEQTLSGVHHKVHNMLQEELQKRDFESLKKDYSEREQQVRELEDSLQKAKKETDTKQEEIEALVKKLGVVELGKALLPSAISGLAKQYPSQMKGIAGTLGRLGINDADQKENDQQENEYMLQILEHLSEVFTEKQFEEVIQLLLQVSDQIKDDQGLIQKIGYYLNQLKTKEESK